MSPQKLPSLFLSHGSPMLALDAGETGAFWRALARDLPQPEAILSVSAHWNTAAPTVSAAKHPETIHDFYGFPEPLYRQRYAPPGAPELAMRAASLIEKAGMPVEIDAKRGLDHGAWVPLKEMYPEARIPVTQLSVQPHRDARWHRRLGAALAPLRDEGVLILASGGAVHNLREMDRQGGATPEWARDFDEWLARALATGHDEELLDWQSRAPNPRRAHPSPEHLLPFYVAWGAAGENACGERLHRGYTLGSMSMAAFRFDAEARAAAA